MRTNPKPATTEETQVKRPAHLTLVDADKYSALVSRCTEQRKRAEKAEARIEVLEKDNQTMARFIREHMAWDGRYYDPGLKKIVDAALRGEEER